MKGILFKPESIQASVEGRKTQTRKLGGLKEINQEPDKYKLLTTNRFGEFIFGYTLADNLHEVKITKPRYQSAETVYIKEACCIRCYENDLMEDACYKTDEDWHERIKIECASAHWRSPIFMPEWAARYFLKITNIRAERLQEITEEDAQVEAPPEYNGMFETWKDCFKVLWNYINPKYPWESNPWVFVYSFKKKEEK